LHELDVLRQELEAAGKGKMDAELRERILARLAIIDQLLDRDGGRDEKPAKVPAGAPAKPITDHDRLQGTWRVVSLTEGGKTTPTNPKDPWVIVVSAGTLKMPYLEGGSSSTGSTGDNSGSSSSGGTSGTSGGWKQKEYTFAVDESKTPRTIDLTENRKQVARGIYEFTLPSTKCASCHTHPFDDPKTKPSEQQLGVCPPVLKNQALMADAGVRLALSIDGSRPAKFGGAGVIVFELKRPDPTDEQKAKLLTQQKEYEAAIRAARDALEKARLEEELARLRKRIDDLIVREAEHQKAVATLRQAEVALEQARTQALVAQAVVDRAHAMLELAKADLARAEKSLADAKNPRPPKPQPDEPVFTVHVRPLTEAEKVVRVKATGKETVLVGLEHATDLAPFKSSEVNVWIVRGKEVLPVDLPAITRNTDTKTNYTLKPGDQLFVQIKPK
jgi:uncharacterized protein (TIGR03067 family)